MSLSFLRGWRSLVHRDMGRMSVGKAACVQHCCLCLCCKECPSLAASVGGLRRSGSRQHRERRDGQEQCLRRKVCRGREVAILQGTGGAGMEACFPYSALYVPASQGATGQSGCLCGQCVAPSLATPSDSRAQETAAACSCLYADPEDVLTAALGLDPSPVPWDCFLEALDPFAIPSALLDNMERQHSASLLLVHLDSVRP